MSTAELNIELKDSKIAYHLTTGDGKLAGRGPDAEGRAELRRVGQTIMALGMGESRDAWTRLVKEFAKHAAFPAELQRGIRRWALSEPERSVLCITSGNKNLASLPWEILPKALNIPDVFVVRLSADDRHPALGSTAPTRMLVAGWANIGGAHLPGIERELLELPGLLVDSRLKVTSLSEPTAKQLEDAYLAERPAILHLSPPSILTQEGVAQIAMAGPDASVDWVPATQLATMLGKNPLLRLLVLNSCEGGLTAARVLAEALGITVVGWAGWIEDKLAYDFAVFFHERLLEGAPCAEAVRAFTHRYAAQDQHAVSPIPVVWVPSLESLSASLFEAEPAPEKRTATRTRQRVGGRLASDQEPVGEPDCNIEFEPLAALSPSLLLNGRAAINRLTLTTTHELQNVRLTIECDAGSGFSSVRQTLDLAKGPNPITNINQMRFPILYELIGSHPGRRYINFVVTAAVDGAVLAESTQPVLMMDTREWMDRSETWPFIPSFVQPNSHGVREIITAADPILKQSGSATESFDGYQIQDAEHVSRQVRAIFVALRDEYSLNYINPPSSPVYLPGVLSPAGQLVRFPDEIVEDRRGTCHDLALLFASCLEHVGIYPILILIQGHTFFGFWRNAEDHYSFWQAQTSGNGGMPRSSDSNWTWILTLDNLVANVDSKSIELVEATDVTNRNADYEGSCATAAKRLSQLRATEFDVAVDVVASRHAVQPIG